MIINWVMRMKALLFSQRQGYCRTWTRAWTRAKTFTSTRVEAGWRGTWSPRPARSTASSTSWGTSWKSCSKVSVTFACRGTAWLPFTSNKHFIQFTALLSSSFFPPRSSGDTKRTWPGCFQESQSPLQIMYEWEWVLFPPGHPAGP